MLNAKTISLLAGCFQQTALVLTIRYSKTVAAGGTSGPSYLNSVAVASSEAFKLALAFALECITNRSRSNPHEHEHEGGVLSRVRRISRPMLVCNDRESLKLVVPALLYLIQNNLLFVALANLSVGMYQVTNQGKLLTTALLSRAMLGKRLSGMQYVSVALLGLGVAFIHLSEHRSRAGDGGPRTEAEAGQNPLLGLVAVLICCLTSGFSGVYFEFVLKKSPAQLSVHCRNFHLATWSLILAVVHIGSRDFEQAKDYGLFYGFDATVVLVVVMQGMTGFMVSMMIKYADNVLKGFAIAMAAVLATLISVPLFGAQITPSFVGGAFVVVIAVKMYGKYDAKKAEVKAVVEEDEGQEELGLLSKGANQSTLSKEER